jgi:hypothetical protein
MSGGFLRRRDAVGVPVRNFGRRIIEALCEALESRWKLPKAFMINAAAMVMRIVACNKEMA